MPIAGAWRRARGRRRAWRRRRRRSYAADPATDDRTPKTAAATIPAPRRSLSEPPFQGDLQTAPPTPVRDGAPPPPPADVDATPRTKLSAFLQTHAVQQQQ